MTLKTKSEMLTIAFNALNIAIMLLFLSSYFLDTLAPLLFFEKAKVLLFQGISFCFFWLQFFTSKKAISKMAYL